MKKSKLYFMNILRRIRISEERPLLLPLSEEVKEVCREGSGGGKA